jgi:hypothetical protein
MPTGTYSIPSLIRISEAKHSPTRKFRAHINGKFVDTSSADENK